MCTALASPSSKMRAQKLACSGPISGTADPAPSLLRQAATRLPATCGSAAASAPVETRSTSLSRLAAGSSGVRSDREAEQDTPQGCPLLHRNDLGLETETEEALQPFRRRAKVQPPAPSAKN